MNVHLLEEKDLEKAYQIYEECFEKKSFNHSYNIRENVLGLYLDNKLIGLCQINFIDNIFEGKRIAYLNSFCIEKSCQHKGYGDYFFKEVIQYCKEKEANKINLTSNKNRIYAHKLYQKNDFNVIDTIFFNKDI